MKIKIIYEDSKGGVKTVSNILHNSLINNSMESEELNLNNYGDSLFKKSINIYKIIKDYDRENILLLQHFDAIFWGIFLKFFGFKKIINVVHTNLVDYYNSSNIIKKIIIKNIFFMIKNDLVVFVSKEAEIKAKEKFNLKNTKTIYNIYKSVNEEIIKSENNIFVFGILARLHNIKNIDLTIRIIKKLKEKYPNIELHIYGEGEEEKKILQYIKKLDCSKFIFLKGFASDKKVFFNSIHGLVSMSSLEGFGMTILESISFKTPILHTDCSSGPREIMSESTVVFKKTNNFEKTNVGYLVKPIKKQNLYIENLDEDEIVYVDIFSNFIDDLEKNSFSMEYNFSRFEEKSVIKKWKKLIEEIQ